MIAKDNMAVNAHGGTELMTSRLVSSLSDELKHEFQFIVSRLDEELDPTKIRVAILHDLPGDPASDKLFHKKGYENFHKLVFVSNWQMQQYCAYYQIPYSRCAVLQNAITPIPNHEKPKDKIRLGYWSTPHRGLEILVPVFEELQKKYDNIELDVYSSFKLYGWEERDIHYEGLFRRCNDNNGINYFGSVDNDTMRKGLENIHILAYPNIWNETSCLVLMEAMSAGILAVHPNLGALFETASNWTAMYQYNESQQHHAAMFYKVLDDVIANYWDSGIQSRIKSAKGYADVFYNWDIRAMQWKALLTNLLNEPRELPTPKFIYAT